MGYGDKNEEILISRFISWLIDLPLKNELIRKSLNELSVERSIICYNPRRHRHTSREYRAGQQGLTVNRQPFHRYTVACKPGKTSYRKRKRIDFLKDFHLDIQLSSLYLENRTTGDLITVTQKESRSQTSIMTTQPNERSI
ncbi:hypothetical protein RF11_05667 [Thelohanellus kitauei]|uniref:Uncharacterized protein n=1 Tax=Thelohanellus kitauei TaxID=669202 RepID=A0A0C2J7L2_THEKT|nr:hypothetical protein RF11_05667 [Thelohanellus kitauei]